MHEQHIVKQRQVENRHISDDTGAERLTRDRLCSCEGKTSNYWDKAREPHDDCLDDVGLRSKGEERI